jgi:tetratricopeptide (TPR) repeat protein
MKKIALLLAIAAITFPLFAQETAVFTEANKHYKKGVTLYEKGVFGKARTEFKEALSLLQPANEPEYEMLLGRAELYYAKCAVQLGLPDGEKLILDFIRKNAPDPVSNQALVDLANYYYNDRQYNKAAEYYARVPISSLNRAQQAEVNFRHGYSLFAQKEFEEARLKFEKAKNQKDEYYYPTHYYLGLCYFFKGDYNQAINNFRVAEDASQYKAHVPYYLTQILFAERRFDELIAYAEPRVAQPGGVRQESEIRQLIGQAYFEKEDYEKALPYLEAYGNQSSKLREEEFYQLGFTQYKTGSYNKAVRSFEQLSSVDSEIGQHAMYALGDSYLKLGRKSSARSAFGAAKRMNYDPILREEALFNYAKLSYELKDPREAIASLQAIGPSSRYYMQAQTLMSEIFLSYRDYQQAMDIIERMPAQSRTPQLRETYQKVTFFRGLQLMQSEDLDNAKQLFSRSLEDPVDQETRALAVYWLGDIAHQQEDYETSIRLMGQFMTIAQTMGKLPAESSIYMANYTQGYNYLKQENYTAALGFLQEAVAGIKRNRSFIANEEVRDRILGDATLRVGDAYFKRNQYSQAVRYYDEAIDQQYSGFVYALYQKAIIEGLRNNITSKILSLERIANNYTNSEYADEALFQLGATYQEIGQLSKAATPLQKLISDYRTSELFNQALIRLGLISYNQGNREFAINYYKQVFANNPTPEEANLALTALEEIYVDDLGQADQYFAFLETIPGYKVDNFARDSINFRAAESQFENANYDRAVVAFTDYIRRFPNGRYTLVAHYHRGESYAVMQQYSDALRDYEYVVSQGNSRYYLKALEKAAIIAYNHEQDFAKSFNLYAQLENAANSENLRFEAQLGGLRSAYRTGNSAAVYNLANKVATNPQATPLQQASASFYLGKMAFDQGDYDNALTAFQRVTSLSDNEQAAEARYQIAYIYYLRRDLERAQTMCINANKESSGYPYWVARSILLLSDILSEKGDLYNARAALEALLENYRDDPDIVNTAQVKLEAINKRINQASRLNLNPESEQMEFQNEGNSSGRNN